MPLTRISARRIDIAYTNPSSFNQKEDGRKKNMQEKVQPVPAAPAVQAHLRTIAQILHEVRHLGPEAQQLLAELVEELGGVLASAEVPSTELAHLAECAAHLVQTAHRPEEKGLAAARDGLEKAAIRVEMEFPRLADIGRRLAETLASLGI
jgi:hypothetical protein